MHLVTFRVMSNIRAHGLHFAAAQEIARFERAGLGREAAVTAGLLSMRSAIRHAQGRGL